MMGVLIDVLSWAFLLAGGAFTIVGAIGMVRMPDLYTRMHAASVIDTLGVGFMGAGMMLQAGFSLITMKILFLLGLFFFVSPVITHALAQAALHVGIAPRLAEDRRARDPAPPAKAAAGDETPKE
ncbi:MAG: monovalent cation/H(+) antiporter subunit G [Hyphomicrobiaceae bacterium]